MGLVADYLMLKKANCLNCYKCIRHCPVKAIRYSDDQAQIVDNDCILCGECFVSCPQNAKEIRRDVDKAKELIASGAPVYVSLAPSFVTDYGNATIGAMQKALGQLGFTATEETAVGATIVKNEYERMIAEHEQDVIISSCCNSINLLIQKHYPEALPYLAHVVSPMQAHSLDIKRRHPGAKTVFIGPCISKKEEAETYPGIVDCVLTFEELTEWFTDEHVMLEKIADENEDSRARLFPTTGGVIRTMNKSSHTYNYLAMDGVENCIGAIKDIIKGNLRNCFIEMSACVGSCIGGPAINEKNRTPISAYVMVDNYAGRGHFPVEHHPRESLTKEMPSLEIKAPHFAKEAIEEVLRQIGKVRPEDELNCGSCGYATCRDKAEAVLQGRATLTMCLPFLKEKAESFSDTVITNSADAILVLDDELRVQQINPAGCQLMNLRSAGDVLGEPVVRILDPLVFIEARKGKNLYNRPLYLAEYRRHVEQTVVYVKEYNILICNMRDVTAQERERTGKKAMSRITAETADQVIEKQLRTVQEIASLLGETAAETQIALTKLKESLIDD
ncbi:MAG: 4Fe-4S dicluster domain-containing protein [Clostridiales bacterium]|nr:4Fe-4S dicluster domain-containing protein [Clostridiales bacterium]